MNKDHQNGNGTDPSTRMEENLRASELRYRRLFEAAQDGILILNVETGRIDDVNPFLVKLLGFTHDEIIGKTVGELSPFKDIVSNQLMLEKVQKDGYVRYHDLPLETKDGRQIAVEFVSNLYEESDKKVIQCNIRDITERKRNQAVLSEAVTTQSSILNALPAQIALISSDGTIISVNEAWRQFVANNALQGSQFGVGQNYLEICERATGNCSEEARDAALGIRRVLRSEIEVFTMEYPCHSPTVQRWFLLRVVPMREDCSAGAVVMHLDISDRKLAEQSLTLSERNMAAAQRIAHLGSWEMGLSNLEDLDANALHWSDEIFRIAGYEPGEVEPSNKIFFQLVPEEEHELVQKAVATAIATGGQYSIAHRIIRRNGEERTVHELAQIFTDETTGQPTKMVGTTQDITEQMEIKKQLLWKTAFFEAQVYSALDGILVVDSDGKKILQNQRLTDLWNIPREFADEIDDKRQREWVAKQTSDPRQFIDKVAYLNGHPDEVNQEEIELVDGRCFDRYSAPVRGSDGKYYGRIWTFRDITERKAAELALHESESRYRSLFENMLEGAAYCRLLFEQGRAVDFIYLEVNTAFEVLSGLQNVIGKKITQLVPGLLEANPELIELYARVAQTGKPESREMHLPSMGVWISLSVYSNKREHFSVVFENITEQKRREARFRRLVDSNAQGVIFWNTKGEVSVANDAYLRLVGYSREDLEAGRINWMTMTPPEYADLDRRALEQVATKGVSDPYEKEYIRKDGSRVPILLGVAAFEDDPNEGVCFFIDLTERKKLEQQFLRAQRMESIGTLAGGIAHDLNNILAPILMSIDILKLTANDPQAESILETIEISAKRGADIVRQVLSFARGLEGERVEVQPKHLLQDVESIIKDTFPKNISLRFSIPKDIWTILGDPTQVHQVLLNLCINARDAMPNGGSLSINVENCTLDEHYAAMNLEAKAGRYVNINVTDTGTGIPSSLLEKIFEPFFTTKGINKGTGLGLSTVIGIVKSHGGLINVYSEPNKGTTFKVYLPAMEASSEARKTQLEQASLPRGNGETVLLVDDEASIITITTQTLQAFGYRVLTATDGAEAVATYAEHKNEIAVVLTDMAMPIMDGAAAIRALSKINPTIKIIAASGLHANADATTASGVGIKHFLTKPYTSGTLLKTLRTILEEP